MSTALSEAMKSVGIVSPTVRLKNAAAEALATSNNNWDRAKDSLFNAVRNDNVLLWALFEPYKLVAAQKLLTEVMSEMRASAKAERGHRQSADQDCPAPLSRTNGKQHIAAKPSGSGHQRSENQVGLARPAPSVRPPVRDPRAAIAATIELARLSVLDTFRVNNRPIGDQTASEALGWAGSRERDVRFVRLLTQNLPANLPIRKFRTGDEANALYEQAKEMTDA